MLVICKTAIVRMCRPKPAESISASGLATVFCGEAGFQLWLLAADIDVRSNPFGRDTSKAWRHRDSSLNYKP
ncbi:CLUMA_CG004677, isoform A [Clunio marinus]|uniref:CLUMA_CG004677, isoform A n=1 Tax=Clunio marinus TaxID=568069 RepID=A0A1J1HSL0_9DIPT|nr:CLUMA_CG004677, isoform A [Clunio marinus]